MSFLEQNLGFLFFSRLNIFIFLLFIVFRATIPFLQAEKIDSNLTSLTPFEKAELRKLIELDFRSLSNTSIQGVLGYDQEYRSNPASVHVIRPQDITLFGYANTVEALRSVPGMHVSRGLAYDNFASMRNFSGFSTQKFLGKIGGREVTQLMLGSANYSVDDYPIAVVDRIEIIRGPGASIWGTNAVNGVINLRTKHSGDTQGDSVRMLLQNNGTFMGDYVHGGEVSDDSFYRVWVRSQEYAEGTLESGRPAQDDGYLRKFGFRYDKELASDLNFYVAGGGAARKLEHVLDLSNRILFDLDGSSAAPAIRVGQGLPAGYDLPPVPLSFAANTLSLPPAEFPVGPSYNKTAWDSLANGTVAYPGGSITRLERYAEMSNDTGHIVSKLDGITDFDLEWGITAAAEQTDIKMGHLGFEWKQNQYDLSLDANRPWGNLHRLSLGIGYRRTDLNVKSNTIEPFVFNSIEDLSTFPMLTFSDSIPILDYDQGFNSFNQITAYIQDSIHLTENIVLSLGSKFEKSDLTGTGTQPGLRGSWMPNGSNVFWLGYSKAHRQPSLRERYTTLNAARVWSPGLNQWVNLGFAGDETLDREEIDAYEIGWRTRPNGDFLVELSSYYYDSKDAVLAATNLTSVNAYEAKDAKAIGGELSFDWEVSSFWKLRGGYSFAQGEIEGKRSYDFPENTGSLNSIVSYSDRLTFTQSLFYSGSTEIPSDYNPITIPSHLRLDLGAIWHPSEDWEIGFFGRDLLEPYHVETMFPGVDVEPARVERSFLLTFYKKF